jgi:hypothetical protein
MATIVTSGRAEIVAGRDTVRGVSYRQQVRFVLVGATLLSMAYTVYTAVSFGTDDLRNPAFYAVYGVWWVLIALLGVDRRWVWWTVAVATALQLLLGVFYYPTIFVPAMQTPLGWFENDAYMGLLLLAEYLCIQRLRGVTIGAER